MEGFSVQVDTRDGCVVLSVAGEVDLGTAPRLREQLIGLVADGHRHVVIDLSSTEFLDSTGLGALVAGFKRLRAHNGEMRLVCPVSRIRKVFELTRLDLVLPIFDSLEDACRLPQ
jgi:anti-sigma B factor antagonist